MSASGEDYGPIPLAVRLLSTTDAAVWATEFVNLFGTETIDFGLMVGWFANAIETGRANGYEQGYDEGQRDTSHALMGLTDLPHNAAVHA